MGFTLSRAAHSPDNSFMGFVIYSNLKNDEEAPAKRNQSLVYGKEVYMWKVGETEGAFVLE